MKKIFLSVAVVSALILGSCGKPSACDCVKMAEEFVKKQTAPGADQAALAKEATDMAEKCKGVDVTTAKDCK